ncbi:hypothetical protein NPIL_10461, partial [Nephila pilipes]
FEKSVSKSRLLSSAVLEDIFYQYDFTLDSIALAIKEQEVPDHDCWIFQSEEYVRISYLISSLT